MTKLPRGVTGDRVVRALKRAGFYIDHQVGSHVTLRHESTPSLKVIVPVHKGKELAPKTLQSILKSAGIDPDELRDLL